MVTSQQSNPSMGCNALSIASFFICFNNSGSKKKLYPHVTCHLLKTSLSVKSTLKRRILAHGRFIVRLPFRKTVSDLGDFRILALKMLRRMEARFEKHASLKIAYQDFLREYLELDHMRLSSSRDRSRREFFLPHHGVIKETSSTTKLRVVFNGSQKTNLGISLNDCLHIGPKLQTDLVDIIVRWRRHRYVFATDVEKMYRQIRVHPDDWPLQKILWRDSPGESPKEYVLCTVTYGLACAPYLALRCLRQLANEVKSTRALAAEILRRDTYVDDILSGSDDISTTEEKMQQLKDTLTEGGFTPKKWISNEMGLLETIPGCDRDPSATLPVCNHMMHCALGIRWNRANDNFIFVTPSVPRADLAITKRSVLSFIARIFNPLGWLAPLTVTAKRFMQELWAIRLDWDDELPESLRSRWIEFTQQFEEVSEITIPRWFGTTSTNLEIELHGFSDASQNAMAAVIYIRVVTPTGIYVTLVSTKTKVAPLKCMTIPRLELSTAVLLVKQLTKIREVLDLNQAPVHLWTDSTIALTWIKSHPSKWKEFVRNRVALIQELSNSRWRHVSGKENPADVASRGTSTRFLQQDQSWWSGLPWLQQPTSAWPVSNFNHDSNVHVEKRAHNCAIAIVNPEPYMWDLIQRYSSLTRLVRVTAWILRAIEILRQIKPTPSSQTPLTPAELDVSLHAWVKLTQHAYFSTEIRLLQENNNLPKSNSLFCLTPYLDHEGRLRLRGRLQFSQLDQTEKHPFILPRSSRLTDLILDHYHKKTLHDGPQLMLTVIRRKFWILGGRLPIRSFIHRCVTCTRHRAVTGLQQMGQLPVSRATPCRPFQNTGVDYAGPLTLRTFRGRDAKNYKGYFVIFICFSTSAIHLEVATDYTTDGFIAAYKRFTDRRGICSTITSDCGTNLIGADAELQPL